MTTLRCVSLLQNLSSATFLVFALAAHDQGFT